LVEDDSATSLQSSMQPSRGDIDDAQPLARLLLVLRGVNVASFSSRHHLHGNLEPVTVASSSTEVSHSPQKSSYFSASSEAGRNFQRTGVVDQHNRSLHAEVEVLRPEAFSMTNSHLEAAPKKATMSIRRSRVSRGAARQSGSLIACGIVIVVSLLFIISKGRLPRKRHLHNSDGNLSGESAAAKTANVVSQIRSHVAANSRPSRAAAVQMTLDESQLDRQASQSESDNKNAEPQYQLYSQRWVQLAYLSLFAFLSDWVCFAVAAEPGTFHAAYGRDPATLIDLFLFTNVLFCFLEPSIVGRFGLRRVITAAGALMSVGCLLRSGVPFSGTLQPYEAVVAGTVLVGAAQPFFQCTPPLLSATWFGSNERAVATATAINFNQIGIGTAFLVGGWLMSDAAGMEVYFSLMSAVSIVLATAAFFQFQERPPTPPTASAASRIAAAEDPNAPPPLNVGSTISLAQELIATPGFVQPLAAFVGSICVSNLVSAFIEDTLRHAGVVSQDTIDIAGAGFQAAIVLGGIVLGGYVDRTKAYKQVTMACLVGGALCLLPLGISGVPVPIVIGALLALGALIGPVQPINAELAVEVAYPADENAIEALQQLSGNLGSALLVPLAEAAGAIDLRAGDTGPSERGDILLLTIIAVCSLLYFNTFNSELKRTAFDCVEGAADDTIGCETVGCESYACDTIDADKSSITIDGDQPSITIEPDQPGK